MMESASLAERIEKCERILKENSNSQVFAALADAYRANGDLDQAFRVCRQGLRVHPTYGPGHLVMARISFERKMFDWAEQELAEAVALDGETRATSQLRVEIQIAKSNFGEAELEIKKLRATGTNPLLIQDLQQRLEKAKKEARRRRNEQAPAVGFAAPTSSLPPSPPTKVQEPPLTLSQMMDCVSDFPNVTSVVCANHDGTAVDHRGAPAQSPGEIAAFGIEMCRNTQTDGARQVLGEAQQIVVETQDATIVIVRLSRYDLVLMCDKDVNLGSMRLKLDEIIDRLRIE
ncbi:MAG: tetratricopeptide repeat protein [candidate division Zixibacteria bacterium]|nr:tetratricopeptide repeat protein [candidate division Zixibacteria bacterium]